MLPGKQQGSGLLPTNQMEIFISKEYRHKIQNYWTSGWCWFATEITRYCFLQYNEPCFLSQRSNESKEKENQSMSGLIENKYKTKLNKSF